MTVSDRDWLLPTVTLPKLRLVGFELSVPGVTPVPDSGIVKVGFEAFEVMVTLPVRLPADTGVKVTLKLVLWPADSVTGTVIPLMLNPVPLIPAREIVTLDPPVLVTVSDSVCLVPASTFPKLRLVGFDPRPPGEIPMPDNGIVRVVLEAFEVMVTLPVTLPADVGVKATLKLALWPADRVTGAVVPLRLNPVPLIPT